MTLSPNQFKQSVVQGQPDLRFNSSIVSCEIDSTSGGGLVAGQSLKMVDSAGGIPKVVECAADDEDVFGFIAYNIKDATFGVGSRVEVMFHRGGVMYMTASAAIARNAKVMVVIASHKVATATAAKSIVGRAFDKAAADGDLIRVVIDLPSKKEAATVAAIATADASDLPSAEVLANQCKVSINAILVAIKAAGLMQ